MQRIVYAAAFLLAMMLNAVAADPWGGGSGSFAGGTVPNATTFSGNVRIDGTLDQRGAISNGGSATCFTGVANVPCFGEDVAATGNVHASVPGNSAESSFRAYTANTLTASFGTWGTGNATLNSQAVVMARYLSGKTIVGNLGTDVGAGGNVFEVRDGTTAGNLLAAVDGAGNLSLAAGATRSKGTITLAAGTGTATVTSGCTPSCTDTTAANAVRCSVATTTLTAVGTGTDVIAYHCF